MKKSVTLLAAATGALAASTGFGSVFWTATNLGVPSDTFGTGPLQGYHSYLVTLTSDSGNITAVDFSGSRGFFAPTHGMHQDWYRVKGKFFSTEQAAKPIGATSYDSFFIFPGNSPANVVLASAPVEDNDLKTSPFGSPLPGDNGDYYGGGTYLHGAWGIVAAAQSTTVDVAYLTLNDSAVASGNFYFLGQVATQNGTFNIGFPEPTGIATSTFFMLASLQRTARTKRMRRSPPAYLVNQR